MSTSQLATARYIVVLTDAQVGQILYKMKTTRVSVAVARKDFAKVLAKAAKSGSRIKVTRYGTTLAGIISRADLTHLQECDENDNPPRRRPTRRASARSKRR